MAGVKSEGFKKLAPIVTVGFDITLLIVAGALIHFRGIDNIDNIKVLNIGMDIVGMMVGILILLCCYIDIRRGVSDYRHFRYMVQTFFIGIFTDVAAWTLDGDPKYRIFSLLVNTIFYLATPLAIVFFWLYCKRLMGIKHPVIMEYDLFIILGCMIEMALCILNMPGGFFFSIDENGTYVRGYLYPFFMGYIILAEVAVFILIFVWRKKLTGTRSLCF
ncbi:MAG: hypothetical protein K6B14_10555 [Lachnospiraceae bacterium]|nr:hypothetical protein [Lachnospiraceae bacterium]